MCIAVPWRNANYALSCRIRRMRPLPSVAVPHLREINVNTRTVVTCVYASVYYRCRTHAALVDSYANSIVWTRLREEIETVPWNNKRIARLRSRARVRYYVGTCRNLSRWSTTEVNRNVFIASSFYEWTLIKQRAIPPEIKTMRILERIMQSNGHSKLMEA